MVIRDRVDTIGEFLMENDMTVYIVIFDRAAYQISGKLFADIAEYIDDHYVDEHTDSRSERLRRLNRLESKAMVCEDAVPDFIDVYKRQTSNRSAQGAYSPA